MSVSSVLPKELSQKQRGVALRDSALPDQGYLVDPITAKEKNIHHVPVDRILDYSMLDHALHRMRTIGWTLPQAVVKGLKGDSDFTFSDFLLVAKIPYYLGGLFLVGSFLAAGKNKVPASRIGAGVALYYVGIGLANCAINLLYRLKYGVDLNLKYRRADGRVENVFASADFPRFDLLMPEHYSKMGKKMGIPPYLADQREAIHEQLRQIISGSRGLKLLLGNTLAAVGAGFIARSDAWGAVFSPQGVLRRIWTQSGEGNIWQRVRRTVTHLQSLLEMGFKGALAPSASGLQKYTLLGLLAVTAYSVYQVITSVHKPKYQPSGASIHTPLISHDLEYNRGQLFQQFIQARRVTGGKLK